MKNCIKKLFVTSTLLAAVAIGSTPAFAADDHKTDLYIAGSYLASWAYSNMDQVWDAIQIDNEIKMDGVRVSNSPTKLGISTYYVSTDVTYTPQPYNPNHTYHSASTHRWKNNEDGFWNETTKTDYDL